MGKIATSFARFIALSLAGYMLIWLSMPPKAIIKEISVSKALQRQRELTIKMFMDHYSNIHKQRLNFTQKRCKEHREHIPKMIKPPIFLVNEEHKIVYCQTPKAATTSWCRIFLVLSGYKNYSDVLKMSADNVSVAWKIHVPRLSSFTPKKQEEIMNNYTKIMIVRNPITRLLSAFNDKLVAKNASDYKLSAQRALSQQILQKFRAGNVTGQYDPTFGEFIRMVVSKEDTIDNIHWRTMHSICFPCDVNYTIIGRFEDIENDSNYILRHAGINLQFPKAIGSHFTDSSNYAKLQQSFSTIPYSDLKSIYKKYEYDFSLFDYEKLIPI